MPSPSQKPFHLSWKPQSIEFQANEMLKLKYVKTNTYGAIPTPSLFSPLTANSLLNISLSPAQFISCHLWHRRNMMTSTLTWYNTRHYQWKWEREIPNSSVACKVWLGLQTQYSRYTKNFGIPETAFEISRWTWIMVTFENTINVGSLYNLPDDYVSMWHFQAYFCNLKSQEWGEAVRYQGGNKNKVFRLIKLAVYASDQKRGTFVSPDIAEL